MKTADEIARQVSLPIAQNNAAIGETNRRLVKIGDGQGNVRPATLLTPRDVFYRSSLDQDDRGVAILSDRSPIPIQSVDGYYDTEVWIANIPGTASPVIVALADIGGFATGGPTPLEAATNAAAFNSPDRLILFRIRPSPSGGRSIYIDVGPYGVAYQKTSGSEGFVFSTTLDIADSTNPATYNPTATALTAGQHRILGIALDPSSGAFFAIPGAAATASGTLPQRSDFLQADYEAIDFTDYLPCGYLYDYYGQTNFAEDDCLRQFDPRLWMSRLGGQGSQAAKYLVQQADAGLPNAQAMGALGTGIVKNTTGTGVQSIAAGSDIASTLGSQTANQVYAAPDGSSGNPSFRAIAKADLTTALTTPPPIGGTTPDAGTFTWLHTNGQKRVTTQFDKTNDASLATVTGLSVTLIAGKSYSFRAILHVTADVTGGHKYAMGGTATATAIIYQINAINNGANAFVINSRQTALGGAAGQAGATTVFTEIVGMITVNAGGTLEVQFAQNVATPATTSSVLVGSTFVVEEIS